MMFFWKKQKQVREPDEALSLDFFIAAAAAPAPLSRISERVYKKVYEAEIRKKNAEIKSLQSQINPHFLYNTLGIIDKSVIHTQKPLY